MGLRITKLYLLPTLQPTITHVLLMGLFSDAPQNVKNRNESSAQVKAHLQLLKDSCENDFAEKSIATEEHDTKKLGLAMNRFHVHPLVQSCKD